MNSRTQSFFVYFLLIVAIGAMFYMGFRENTNVTAPLTINQVAKDVQDGKVAQIIIKSDDTFTVVYKDGTEEEGVESRKESSATLVEQLSSLGVTMDQLAPEKVSIEVRAPSVWGGVLSGALYLLPVLFMGGVLWFIFRQAQGSNNAAMSFGKSRARMFSGEHPTVTFADVAGAEESKQELAEVVEFLKEPQKFIQLGARIPKG
ncbi:MAG: cell division protein FtsH, partial [Anaerolineales bacterium]|nr:cell division protein FtsH [Anaerolineales bacterium]